MKTSFAKRLAARKKQILKKLADARKNRWYRELRNPNPVIGSNNVKYELAERSYAINYGGLSAMLKLAKHVGLVVIRKNISKEQGEARLLDKIRYYFYISNDPISVTVEEIVFGCNDRCDQENLIAQLTGGVRSLCAPVDNLLSNWAYMVMTSLAWNLKAWTALLIPVEQEHQAEHRAEKKRLLTMEFRTFVKAIIFIPCQIINHARQTVHRLLNWTDYTPAFFRLCEVLNL